MFFGQGPAYYFQLLNLLLGTLYAFFFCLSSLFWYSKCHWHGIVHRSTVIFVSLIVKCFIAWNVKVSVTIGSESGEMEKFSAGICKKMSNLMDAANCLRKVTGDICGDLYMSLNVAKQKDLLNEEFYGMRKTLLSAVASRFRGIRIE